MDSTNMLLKVGDWFLMEYGFDVHKFYIAEICGNMVRLSKSNWLASSGEWLTRENMELRHAQYIGHGKQKWYWRWLPWRDCITPFYAPKPQIEMQVT